MSKLAVILTGFDDVCCRSNSLSNYLIIQAALESDYSTIHIYVHPSEFKILYKYFVKFTQRKDSRKRDVKVTKGWDSGNNYDEIYTVYSSVISSFSPNQKYKLIDGSIPAEYISRNIQIKGR